MGKKGIARPVKRFLFVQSTTEQGGAETVLLNALSASSELREESCVVTLGFGRGDLGSRLRALGVEIIELAEARLRHPHRVVRTVSTIASLARERGVRAVIGNGTHPQVFGGLAARLAHVPSVYLVHAIHRRRLLANHPIEVLAVKGPVDLALANSRVTLDAMRCLRPSVRVELLHPGTPLCSIAAEQVGRTRAGLGAKQGDVLFGIFGRLQRSKGQDLFLEAAARTLSVVKGSRFAVVGGSLFGFEREFEEQLRSLAGRLGLADRVTFLGHSTDVALLMASCDVVCHATRLTESFGMVLVEAMAQGRPVIATRSGGPSDIVVDGMTGLLVAPDDVAGLAEAMTRLGSDSLLRSRMGAAGLTRVREEFSSDAFARRLREILSQAG